MTTILSSMDMNAVSVSVVDKTGRELVIGTLRGTRIIRDLDCKVKIYADGELTAQLFVDRIELPERFFTRVGADEWRSKGGYQ